MNNISQTDRQAIPLISKLPIIGTLFKSKAERAEQTELMVLITPRLIRPLDPDEVPALPTQPGEFLDHSADQPPGTALSDAPRNSPPPAPNTTRKPPSRKER